MAKLIPAYAYSAARTLYIHHKICSSCLYFLSSTFLISLARNNLVHVDGFSLWISAQPASGVIIDARILMRTHIPYIMSIDNLYRHLICYMSAYVFKVRSSLDPWVWWFFFVAFVFTIFFLFFFIIVVVGTFLDPFM